MTEQRSDVHIYSCTSSSRAEEVRKILLQHRPRPWVFVFTRQGVEEYQVHVATEWHTYPSDEFVASLKKHLAQHLPETDLEGVAETQRPEAMAEVKVPATIPNAAN